MEPTSRADHRYDAMTIVLHWFMALLIVVLWVGAKTIDWLPRGAPRADARSLHIVLGLILGALGGARFVWRLTWGRPLPPTDTGWMGAAAKATHNGLYALLAAMVAVGILLAWTTGDSVFNHFTPASPDPDTRALIGPLKHAHDVIGWLIVAVAGLHTGAVLVHQYGLHDGVLRRMLPAGAGRK